MNIIKRHMKINKEIYSGLVGICYAWQNISSSIGHELKRVSQGKKTCNWSITSKTKGL